MKSQMQVQVQAANEGRTLEPRRSGPGRGGSGQSAGANFNLKMESLGARAVAEARAGTAVFFSLLIRFPPLRLPLANWVLWLLPKVAFRFLLFLSLASPFLRLSSASSLKTRQRFFLTPTSRYYIPASLSSLSASPGRLPKRSLSLSLLT